VCSFLSRVPGLAQFILGKELSSLTVAIDPFLCGSGLLITDQNGSLDKYELQSVRASPKSASSKGIKELRDNSYSNWFADD